MKNGLLVALAIAAIAVPLAIAALQDRDRLDPVKAPPREPPAAPSPRPAPAAPISAAPASTWSQPAMDRAFFDEVFLSAGPHPGLGHALAGLRFGRPSAEQPPLWRTGSLALFDRASARLTYDDGGGLAAVIVSFPDDGTSAIAILAAGWGPPLHADDTDGAAGTAGPDRRAIWFDPQQGLRAALRGTADRAEVEIAPYAPPTSRRDPEPSRPR